MITKDFENRIKFLEAQMKEAELYSLYWMTQANTGVFPTYSDNAKWGNTLEESKEAKIKNALQISLRHIDRLRNLNECRSCLLEGKEIPEYLLTGP